MRPSNFYLGLGLVTLSGCMWFLACTPFDLAPLAWIAAVPMLLAIDRAPTVRRALLLGWWAGVVETGGGFYWIIDLTQRFARFPWIAAFGVFALFCASRALIFLLFTSIVAGVRRRRPVPMTLIAPLAMAASEYLVPQIFPCGQWITQAWQPLVIQVTDLTGPYGVTALLMTVNGALYDAGSAVHAERTLRARGARAPLVSAAVVLAAALIYGAVRMHAIDAVRAAAPRLAVGLVQPNFPYNVDGEFSVPEARGQLEALQGESRRLEQAGAELIVWSEGAYPAALPRDLASDFGADSAAMIRRGLTSPLLAGAVTYDASTSENAFNSALLIDPRGTVMGRYDKVELLAFGEYLPGAELMPWLRHFIPEGAGRFNAGTAPEVLSLSTPAGLPWALGPVICYEDILPDYLARVGRLHPNLLVNLTSDSWFGAGSEPWEHLALSVFAAVEIRADMVRAVNSGVSALIDANGRLLEKTYADDPYRNPRPADGLVVRAARMPGGKTLYVRLGDWFAASCTLACALLGLAAARSKVILKTG